MAKAKQYYYSELRVVLIGVKPFEYLDELADIIDGAAKGLAYCVIDTAAENELRSEQEVRQLMSTFGDDFNEQQPELEGE